jgi:hypothetical protein
VGGMKPIHVCDDCRGILAQWVTTEGSMWRGKCCACDREGSLFSVSADYIRQAVRKILTLSASPDSPPSVAPSPGSTPLSSPSKE